MKNSVPDTIGNDLDLIQHGTSTSIDNPLQKEIWDDIKEYKDDYKTIIKQRERNRIPFFHQSPQFTYRPHLIKFMKQVCIEKKLTHCCLHLAIYLLDVFMDNHTIVPDRLLIVTNVCLLVAAKFEENTNTIPRIFELNLAINNRYTVKEYKDLELVILKFFDWYIMFPTAAHYVHFYMQGIISCDDLNRTSQKLRTLFYNLHDSITKYLDQVIDNVHYMQCYPPSKLAAAIIAASRLDVGLCSWTEQLERLTDYNTNDIKEPLSTLLIK